MDYSGICLNSNSWLAELHWESQLCHVFKSEESLQVLTDKILRLRFLPLFDALSGLYVAIGWYFWQFDFLTLCCPVMRYTVSFDFIIINNQ